ncbi:hypothetical protein [Escherichia coli]|uniref:hypothetical protein n=1 Tax=Escherichia coli TaxID=562 RepID=UPI00202BB5A6|nr:hypothetical protein [Escherichia coli]
MDALQLLTWSLILYLFASLASLFLLGLDRLAIKLSGITSLVGGVIGIISGITQLHAGVTLVAHFATPFDFADLTLRMDSLSAFMVLVISLLVVALFIDLYARIRGQRRGGDGLLYESFHRIDGCPAGDGQRFLVHRAV